MKWVNLLDRKPVENGKLVLFDGTETPPVWGAIKYNGEHTSIMVFDSSGEGEYLHIEDYTRWLDETPNKK